MTVLYSLVNLSIAILSIYLILISIRIIITWFPLAPSSHPAVRFLGAIVDPYLNLFRGMRFLITSSGMNFTPLVGILLINLVISFLSAVLANPGNGTLVMTPFILIWGTVEWFLGFYFILCLIRFVTLVTGWGGYHPALQVLDKLIQPMVIKITRLVSKRLVTYKTGIILLMAALVLVTTAGHYGIIFLTLLMIGWLG